MKNLKITVTPDIRWVDNLHGAGMKIRRKFFRLELVSSCTKSGKFTPLFEAIVRSHIWYWLEAWITVTSSAAHLKRVQRFYMYTVEGKRGKSYG